MPSHGPVMPPVGAALMGLWASEAYSLRPLDVPFSFPFYSIISTYTIREFSSIQRRAGDTDQLTPYRLSEFRLFQVTRKGSVKVVRLAPRSSSSCIHAYIVCSQSSLDMPQEETRILIFIMLQTRTQTRGHACFRVGPVSHKVRPGLHSDKEIRRGFLV